MSYEFEGVGIRTINPGRGFPIIATGRKKRCAALVSGYPWKEWE
jgi:hypothetical protein